MPRHILTTFRPLCRTRQGRNAVKCDLPPFIDGSIRREPDFKHDMPAITGLCRPGFVNRLTKGDVVVYMTVKGVYPDNGLPGWRLVAMLEVDHIEPDHHAAAEWYRDRAFTELPNNLMVPDNEAKDYEESAGHACNSWAQWDDDYVNRATKSPKVAICSYFQDIQPELYQPLYLNPDNMRRIFNRIPRTQTPPYFRDGEWDRLLRFRESGMRSE